MAPHFCRPWRDDTPAAAEAKRRGDKERGRSAQPRLELLENRWLPAPWLGSLGSAISGGVPAPEGGAGLMRPGGVTDRVGTAAAAPLQVDVTVPMNSGGTVYDLSKVLAGWEGWGYQVPPRISVVRNTNQAVVTTRLTDTELKLSYAAGKSGTARVTVGLTDAAGVSTQVVFDITVEPGSLVGVAQHQPLKLPSTGNPLVN
jgi:hypothetical protein